MLAPFLLALAIVSGDPSTEGARTIAFVGDLEGPRAAAFTSFLEERFDEVLVLSRDGLDPAEAARADVVLLDWDQESGVSRWFADPRLVLEHPLGDRESWQTPTVLLGSAGLNTAAAWDVRGGSG